MNRIKDIGR